MVAGDEVKEFVAAAVIDPNELLFDLKRQGKFNRDFRTTPGKIAYHLSCHLKAQQIGFCPRDIVHDGGNSSGNIMRKIDQADILSVEQWERVRTVLRPLFIHEKERRRLGVGSHLTFLFENTATLWYQVEEMIRSERLTDAAAIQHEIDTYNELIPARGEISATLLLEFAEAKERDAALHRLVGIEKHLWLKLGDTKIPLIFDERQMSAERVSAVQFVRFNVAKDADTFSKLARANAVSILVDHPNLGAEAFIGGTLAMSLAEDLAD